MNLSIRKLLRPGAEPASGSVSFDLSGYDFPQYTVTAPVQLSYTASPEGGYVRLGVTLQAEVSAECARCLAPATAAQLVEKEYLIGEEDLREEFPELPFTADGSLDLKEFAYGELVLEVQPVLLCSESCEGLCPRCGKAKSDCGCKPQKEVDPRLQSLLQLLED